MELIKNYIIKLTSAVIFFSMTLLLIACQENKAIDGNGNENETESVSVIRTPTSNIERNSQQEIRVIDFLQLAYMDVVMKGQCNKSMDFGAMRYESKKPVEMMRFMDEIASQKIEYAEAISKYKTKLSELEIPYEAWFLADVFEVVDSALAAKLWKKYQHAIMKGGKKEELTLFTKIWHTMIREAAREPSEKQMVSQKWLERMRIMPFIINFERVSDSVWADMDN